jgi:hypothetical protein
MTGETIALFAVTPNARNDAKKTYLYLRQSMGQKYGQHFLHDQSVLSRIAGCIESLAATYHTDTTLEI